MSAKEERKAPHCSFCDSIDVTLIAPFGSAQLVRQFYCNDCHSVFEYIRWQNVVQEEMEQIR
jgi:formate dehydrogenase maturation protein FdhE